jgi:hypothetical protein
MSKLFKIQGRSKKTEVINTYAKELGLYDPRFEDKDQCSGYFAFKELCNMNKDPMHNVESYNSPYATTYPGYYTLNRIHPVLRQSVLNSVKELRQKFK